MSRFIVLFTIVAVAISSIGIFNTSTAFADTLFKGMPSVHSESAQPPKKQPPPEKQLTVTDPCLLNDSLPVCGKSAVLKKVQPKCDRPAIEFFKEAEHYRTIGINSAKDPGYKLFSTLNFAQSNNALLFYQICSRLEQNK